MGEQGRVSFASHLRVQLCSRKGAGHLLLAIVAAACSTRGNSDDESQLGKVTDAVRCTESSNVASSPAWTVGTTYAFGTYVTYGGVVYQAIKQNVAQASQTPDIRTDLWTTPNYCIEGVWQANTAYPVGSVVAYNGQRYVSLVATTNSATVSPDKDSTTWQLQTQLTCPSSSGASFGSNVGSPPTVSVGRMGGNFQVTQLGNAQYTIPIEVPPGRGGIQPDLKVVYDSTSGQGLFGLGTNLAGLSEIARCGSNMSDDRQLRSVQFDSNDHFCLDGQRLVAVGGDTSTTTEYRTEPDTFRKVVAYLNTSNASLGPISFRVYSKDGTVSEYGGTPQSDADGAEATSRVMATGGMVTRWELSKLSDRSGNFFTVKYQNEANRSARDNLGPYTVRFAPLEIDYTGHQASDGTIDLQPTKSLIFTYGRSRNFSTDAYLHGLHIDNPDLLTQVDVRSSTTLVRSYGFDYGTYSPGPTVARPDRLASVSVNSGDSKQLGPTKFLHKSETSTPPFDGLELMITNLHQPASGPLRMITRIGDVNGDGYDDVITLTEQLTNDTSGGPPVKNTVQVALQVPEFPFLGLVAAQYATFNKLE